MSQAAKSQIDPINRKNYGAISPMLVVADLEKAYEFCQKAFGFEGRGIMPGPDGKRQDSRQHSNHSLPLRGRRGSGSDTGR